MRHPPAGDNGCRGRQPSVTRRQGTPDARLKKGVRGTSPSTDTVTSDLLAPRESDRSALLLVGLRGDS